MFKSHLEMIGRNEPVSKKAKFWQSYVRSLKGSEDIKAPENTHSRAGIFRPYSDFPELSSTTWPYGKSIYDDPIHASDRITSPGYRYAPLHRDIYGYSPRAIHPHQYTSSYRPIYRIPLRARTPFVEDDSWQDHLSHLRDIGSLYPSRYPLYVRYHTPGPLPRQDPTEKHDPNKAWQDHLDRLAEIDRLYPSRNAHLPMTPVRASRARSLSPTPIKPRLCSPRPNEVAYNYAGEPIFTPGADWPQKIRDLLNPSPSLPRSAITRDPWWWDMPDLRPHEPSHDPWGRSQSVARDSYLSPVKNTYLWNSHPFRPLVVAH